MNWSFIVVENPQISAEVNGMVPFTIYTVVMPPFLSVLWPLATPPRRRTRGITRHGQGGWFSAHSTFDTAVAAAALLLLTLAVIPLHPPFASDEIGFDSVIRLRSHKPIHCAMLLCKLMRSSQKTMLLHHLHNQTFRSAAICSETHLLLLCHLY